MVITSDFLIAATVALTVSLLLLLVVPRIATVLATQIVLCAVGVYFGLSVSSAISCAVITVWLMIVVTVWIKKPQIQVYTQTTKRFFK